MYKITNTVNSMMCCRMLSSRARKMATAMSNDAELNITPGLFLGPEQESNHQSKK